MEGDNKIQGATTNNASKLEDGADSDKESSIDLTIEEVSDNSFTDTISDKPKFRKKKLRQKTSTMLTLDPKVGCHSRMTSTSVNFDLKQKTKKLESKKQVRIN